MTQMTTTKIPNISIVTNKEGKLTFRLNKSLRVWLTSNSGTMLFIPKKFETSIKVPWVGWVLLNTNHYLAFIIHGYLYDKKTLKRQKADVELLNILLRTEPVWKCYVVYFLTSIFSRW